MVFHQKSYSATTSVAKHGAMFILYIISAQVVPVLVPEPVPEVQVGASGVRAVPEVTAFAPQVLIRGNAPLPYGDSPRRPI